MCNASQINPVLTLEYMQTENENKYFDRKSGRIRAADLASHISAFANADGGTLVIGIGDKKREIEGIDFLGDKKINELLNAPKDCCRPMPRYQAEFIDVINDKGKPDRLLLLHIEAGRDQIIRTANDRTYLRIGDKSKEMLGENLRNLEYAKGARHFEDEVCAYAAMEDLDGDLLKDYKKYIGAEALTTEQVLFARGFLYKQDGKDCLSNAAVLLFAKNVMRFYPNCRVRFLRIDGMELQVGGKLNVVKDKSIDLPILRLIDEVKQYVSDQLRTFTKQDSKTGKFIEVPEYPEFPWLEGIVNAVVHRDYAMSGAYIKVSMYDDRLEIESPGCLPDVVTVDNIRETRFSRNPKISRVLTEFGYVRELNEGVKKIYSDMKEANLREPEYKNSANSVQLVLRNNVENRTSREMMCTGADEAKNEAKNEAKKIDLSKDELVILKLMRNKPQISQTEMAKQAGYSKSKVQRITKALQEKKVICRKGGKKGGIWEVTK